MANNQLVVVAAASIFSCAAGSLTAYILTKKYVASQYETLIEEEVAKAKEFYSRRSEADDIVEDATPAVALPDDIPEESDTDEDPRDQEHAYIDGDIKYYNKDARGKTEYNKIARSYAGDDMPPKRDHISNTVETTEDDGDPGEEGIVKHNIFDRRGLVSEEELDRSQRNNGRPYILSQEEFMQGDFEQRSQTTLTYYEGDHVLADEREQPIDNINRVVGEENLKFGHASGDANIVYIRNEYLDVDFEVLRSTGSYSQEVLGGY